MIILATKYQTFDTSGGQVLIENGNPIIVHGITYYDSQNSNLYGLEKNGTTIIFQTYSDSFFGANPTLHLYGPFLANNGLILYSSQVLSGLPGAVATVRGTIFYSHMNI